MKTAFTSKFLLMALGIVLFSTLLTAIAVAEPNHGKRKRNHEYQQEYLYPMPAGYKENCGSCHMAYGAYLLPQASWRKMLDTPLDHFGTELSLDESELALVSDYLLSNAADRNGGKIGRRIMKHSGPSTPERISSLPYIQRKHRKVNPDIFARPSIGGIQNCSACHLGAQQGDFKSSLIKIPQ